MRTDDQLKRILHQYGLKVTVNRINVLRVLMDSPSALSHTDIISRIDDRKLDKVTLYRTLDAFTGCGLAHKVANEERNWLYALHMHGNNPVPSGDDHAHFICDHCDRIYCLPMGYEETQPLVKRYNGFVIRSHEYRLHGTCPKCN